MAFLMGKKYKFVETDIPELKPAEGTSFEFLNGAPTSIYIKLLFEEGFAEDEKFIFKYPVVKFVPLISETDFSETAIDVSGAYCYVDGTGTDKEIYMVYNFAETFKPEEGEPQILPTFYAGNYIFYNPTDHSDYIQAPYGADDFDFEGVKKYAPWPMQGLEDAGNQ